MPVLDSHVDTFTDRGGAGALVGLPIDNNQSIRATADEAESATRLARNVGHREGAYAGGEQGGRNCV